MHGRVVHDRVGGFLWEEIYKMPYNPNLKAPMPNPRALQNERYNNLAAFMTKISTVSGRHQFSEAGMKRLLVGSRVLTREGHVRHDRLNRLATSIGVHASSKPGGSDELPAVFYDYEYGEDYDIWDDIVEGGS